MTDGELVRRARLGEAWALAELMNRWAPKALALCHVQTNRQAAPDLAQESLLRALRSLAQLKVPDRFGAWLRGIVKRVCCDWIDARRRSMVVLSSIHSSDGKMFEVVASDDESAHREEQLSDLHSAMNELPEECREALHLYYTCNMTYQELGELLEVSAATINARLTRARTLLRASLLPSTSPSLETRS